MGIIISEKSLIPVRRDGQISGTTSMGGGGNSMGGGGGSAPVWGTIIGSLSDQGDLVSAFNLKANLASPSFTGNVGIGTTNPGRLLTLEKDTANDMGPTIYLWNNQYSNNVGAGSEIIFGHYSSTSAPQRYSRIASIGDDVWGTPGRMLFGFGIDGAFTEQMSLKYGVGLGIGTTSPMNKLTVQRTATTVGTQNTYHFGVGVDGTNTDLTIGTDATYSYIQSWNRKPLQINQQGNNTIINGVNGGNVGIGTTSPTQPLHVIGNGIFSGWLGIGCTPSIDLEVANNGIKTEQFQSRTTFVTGFAGAGYKMTITGAPVKSTFEVDNLIVRNTLKAYTFEVDKIDVIGGSLVISPASGTVSAISSNDLHFDTAGGVNPIQFKTGDYIKAQQWVNYDHTIIASYFGHVVDDSNKAAGYITMDTVTGAWAGMRCSQWGSSSDNARQNMLYMTSSDSNNPFIEGHTGVTTGVLNDTTRRFRLGNLTGITDTALSPSGYGLYCNNVFLKGAITITSGSVPNSVVSGLGALATKSSVDLSSADVTNKSLSNVDSSAASKLNGIAAGAQVNTINAGDGLSALDSAAASKLNGIASNATVGAVWGTNIAGMPGYTGPAFGKGLFMNDSYMGFYNYTDHPSDPWRAYIDSNGNARFVGVTEIGTNPATYSGKNSNVAIMNGDIWENSYAGDSSGLHFCRLGYQGGNSYYRSVYIGDGKGVEYAGFEGSTQVFSSTNIRVNNNLRCDATVDFTSCTNINFNSNHFIATGTDNINCAVAEYDMANMSITMTPKGGKILVMFSAPFVVDAGSQTVSVFINIGGSNVRKQVVNIYTNRQTIAFHHIATVTPNSAITVKIRWSGTTAIHQYGSTDSERILTVVNLF